MLIIGKVYVQNRPSVRLTARLAEKIHIVILYGLQCLVCLTKDPSWLTLINRGDMGNGYFAFCSIQQVELHYFCLNVTLNVYFSIKWSEGDVNTYSYEGGEMFCDGKHFCARPYEVT